MYTVKAAADRVGIATSTLRAWERRYGIVTPRRTAAGYRVYSEEDIVLLNRMAKLIAEGQTPSLAAPEALRRTELESELPADRAVPIDAATATGDPFAEALTDAAARHDSVALATILDEMYAQGSYESVVDELLMPALVSLGDGWEDGRVSVAGEHLATNAVMRRLAAAYEAAASRAAGPRLLIGTAPGARHELGLLAFATAARRRGFATDYLGADVPVADWATATKADNVAAVVLATPMADDIRATEKVIDAILKARPQLLIAIGGHAQEQAPPRALRLGHSIRAAPDVLAQELASASRRAAE